MDVGMIMQACGIYWAAYHGSNLQGINIQNLMGNAKNIMTEVSSYIPRSKSDNGKL